jgi:hypothetical protein
MMLVAVSSSFQEASETDVRAYLRFAGASDYRMQLTSGVASRSRRTLTPPSNDSKQHTCCSCGISITQGVTSTKRCADASPHEDPREKHRCMDCGIRRSVDVGGVGLVGQAEQQDAGALRVARRVLSASMSRRTTGCSLHGRVRRTGTGHRPCAPGVETLPRGRSVRTPATGRPARTRVQSECGQVPRLSGSAATVAIASQ